MFLIRRKANLKYTIVNVLGSPPNVHTVKQDFVDELTYEAGIKAATI